MDKWRKGPGEGLLPPGLPCKSVLPGCFTFREAPGREAPGREAPGREMAGREAMGREVVGKAARRQAEQPSLAPASPLDGNARVGLITSARLP